MTSPFSAPAGRVPRSVLVLSFLALVLEGYDLTMYGTVVPDLLAQPGWNVTPDTAGHIASMAVVGMLIGAFLAAVLTHRIARRNLLAAGVATFSAGMALCSIAGSAQQLGALRFVVGLGVGVLMPTVAATLVEFAPVGKRALHTAIGFAGVGVGGCLAGLLGSQIVPDHGFRPMFVIGAAPALVVVPLLLRFMPLSMGQLAEQGRFDEAAALAARFGASAPDPDAHGGRPRTSLNDIRTLLDARHAPAMVLFSAATFLCLMLMYGAAAWLPTLMISAGYGVKSSLAFLLVLNVGATIGGLLASPVADRAGFKPVVLAGFLAAAVSLVVLPHISAGVVVIALIALVGAGSTGTQVLMNAFVGSYFPGSLRASALGLALGVGRVGGIVGPMYGAMLISDHTPTEQFYGWAIPGIIGAILIALVPLTRSADRPATPMGDEGRAVSGAR